MRDPCDLIDLIKTAKPFISYLCITFKKCLKLYGCFLWMRFNCLKATEPLPGGSFMDLFYHFHYSNHSFSFCFVSDQVSQYILKLVVNKTGKINEEKSET